MRRVSAVGFEVDDLGVEHLPELPDDEPLGQAFRQAALARQEAANRTHR